MYITSVFKVYEFFPLKYMYSNNTLVHFLVGLNLLASFYFLSVNVINNLKTKFKPELLKPAHIVS